ncbi:alpha/beta hydrolase [Alkalibacillus silvisoli]
MTNNKKLHICEEGQGEKTVILVHGLTGNHKQMAYYQEALGEHYRVISYDLRGRGLSDEASEPTSIDHHVGDLVDLIMRLDLETVTLIGYSIGAYICAKVTALSSRVTSLVLLDGAGVADLGQKELILPSLERLRKTYQSKDDYIRQTKQTYEKLQIKWTNHLEDLAHYETKETNEGVVHRSKVSVMEQDFNSFFDYKHEEILPNIDIPVLLVKATGYLGPHRPLFFNESFTELEKSIRKIDVMITGADHLSLVFEKQKDVLLSVERFLQRATV